MSTTVAYYLCGRRAGRRRRRNLLLLFTAATMVYLMYRDAPESVLRAEEEGDGVATVLPVKGPAGGGGGGGGSVKAADVKEPPSPRRPSPAPAAVVPASASRSRSRAPPAPSASTSPAPPSPSGSTLPQPPPASPSAAATKSPASTPSPSSKPSVPAPAPPQAGAAAGSSDEARALASSPQARQDFFVDCLRSSLRASCRPRADDPPFVVLPRDAWRAHVADVLKFTVPHRAVPGHSYGGYSGPWVESVFITYFMGLDTGKPDEMGYRRRLRALLRRRGRRGLRDVPPPVWEGDDVNATEAAVLPYTWRRALADDGGASSSRTGGPLRGDVPDPARGSILDALERAFYPLVPVFARWSDAAFGDDRAMHPKNKELFEHQGNPAGSPLRRDVVYVALSQHDRGEVASGLSCNHYRNVVSLSSGGWGSVAIPLIKGTAAHVSTEPVDAPTAGRAAAAVAGGSPQWQARPRLRMFSFVGTNHLGRNVAFDAFQRSSLPGGGGSPWFDTLMTPDWRGVARSSVFTLSPRGYGRTSFRLYELLQYGSVSVYLYDDVAWTPYQHGADFEPPGSLPPALTDGGRGDVRRFGAVPLRADNGGSASAADDVGVTAPLTDAQVAAFAASDRGKAGWSGPGRYAVPGANVTAGVLNAGGMWGPGGVGFAVAYDEVGAFVCVACDFLLPGSAARWRHVRVLPLHRYGAGAGKECPCSAAAWEEVARGMTDGAGPSPPWVLPADSLVAEMERRVAAVRDRYFTYRGVMGHVATLLRLPLESELVCVPKPDDYGTPRSDPPFIE